jgi:predicted regulator of Ras-like GTPase activity (Roadblock/LC7/MglB family)
MLPPMDAAQALADLTEISSQVVQVAILDRDGTLLATTIADSDTASAFVTRLERFVVDADAEGRVRGLGDSVTQVEAATLDGSVFVVRAAGRTIAATTRPDPTVGLVLYDLKRCLETLDESAAPTNGAGATRLSQRRRSPARSVPRAEAAQEEHPA